jgi:DNA-binding PadR family transcriptional regulator
MLERSLDPSKFSILVALAVAPQNAAEIHQQLAESPRGVPVATFYRRLSALLKAGWIAAGDDDTDGPGRPAQRYSLTDSGRAAMRAEAKRLRHLAGVALGDEASL